MPKILVNIFSRKPFKMKIRLPNHAPIAMIIASIFTIFIVLLVSKSVLIPNSDKSISTNYQGQKEGKKISNEWFEKIHKTASGDDWRKIEAASIRQLLNEKSDLKSERLSGTWLEKGPSNIPGRIVDIDLDYLNNRIYALSDHGIVFQSSDLNGDNWNALNDRFPLGLGVAAQMKVFSGEVNKIVVSGYIKVDQDWGIYCSNDNGLNWIAAGGIGTMPIMGIRRLMTQGDDVYAFIQEYSAFLQTDFYSIYKSENQGFDFYKLYQSNIPSGNGSRHIMSDMWVSNNETDPNLYLLIEDSLFLVNKMTGSRIFNSRVSGQQIHQGLLTGLSKNGITELVAYSAINDTGKFYTWSSAFQSWQFRGELTESWLAYPFGANSLSCSQLSADTIYFGSILTSRSVDGGETWTTIDLDPSGSYALYHGDVPKTLNIINPASGLEETYMGTDGGLYRLDNADDHFVSLSIPGLNCTQIYKMVSNQNDPGKMFIGTQDNGYCYTLLGNEQPQDVDFTFLWGGDVSNAASGDGGETFWLWWLGDGCNYMSGPDENNILSTWSPYSQNGSVPYWEAPIWISNHHPDRCYTAGSLNNSTGNHLLVIQAVPGGSATGTQLPYNFLQSIGGKISAIAISPIDSNYFYVTTENGYFLRSTDGGNTWANKLLSFSMYPRVILPSKFNLGEVWVGGSGYSNSPVYYSINNGQNFTSLNFGLPSCLVEALAVNDDESVIFAATSIGPFAREVVGLSWADISEEDAPLLHYMDVEYISQTQTVRFATYARGIWDYRILNTTSVKDLDLQANIRIYPNPASSYIVADVNKKLTGQSYTIFNMAGEKIIEGVFNTTNHIIDLHNFKEGFYILKPNDNTSKSVKFLKKPF